MAKIRIDLDKLCEAYPEARKLEVLPRKKKKALKKKIARMLISLLTENAFQIFLENSIYDETYGRLVYEMENTINKLEQLKTPDNVKE
jgi:hypothetical protein